MPSSSPRLRALLAWALAGLLLVPAPAEAGPGKAKDNEASRERRKPDLDRIDPVRFKLEEAIVERAFVAARDGLTQLAVDVIRPNSEEPVPAILFQSPYYNTTGRGYRSERKLPWNEPAVPSSEADGPQVPFPEWYDEYFVPRGYAVVMQDQRGTRNSSGCQMYGAREEITDAVDVIEWIASRAWSNGTVGMTGGSYDGTIAVGAASMAPPSLKAIIPIRSIDRWYDYHFFNGLQSAEHIVTPANFAVRREVEDQQNSYLEDSLFPVHVIERKACAASIGALTAAQYSTPYQDSRSGFWAGRDFVKDAEDITAAVFIIHGLLDTNVKTTNTGHLWQALPKGLPKKLWLARMEHGDPKTPDPTEAVPFPFDELFIEYTHRWFAQFLKGIDTGVSDEPPVQIQSETGKWFDATRWPGRTKDLPLYPTPDGRLSA
ncbi:MAG: CocE/NonD family hydrolase, partial [Actinomycetota bacterium]